eukprot:m.51249 g.51249  ORF g.51249 m.51249 type:complete len:1083 (-) comp7292_c0_seq1:177-3425(-)
MMDSNHEGGGGAVGIYGTPENHLPSLQSRFTHAVERTKASKAISAAAARETSTRDKLLLYAYYKQARNGPCTRAKPRKWEVIKRAKWEAWYELGDMPREEAMQRYITMLLSVVTKLPDAHSHEVAKFANEVSDQPLLHTNTEGDGGDTDGGHGGGGGGDSDSGTSPAWPPLTSVSPDDEALSSTGSPHTVHGGEPRDTTPNGQESIDDEGTTLDHEDADGDGELVDPISTIRSTIRRRRSLGPTNEFDRLFTRVSGTLGQMGDDGPADTAATDHGNNSVQARQRSLTQRLFSQDEDHTLPTRALSDSARAATHTMSPLTESQSRQPIEPRGSPRTARRDGVPVPKARHVGQATVLDNGAESGSSALSSDDSGSETSKVRSRRRRRKLPTPPGQQSRLAHEGKAPKEGSVRQPMPRAASQVASTSPPVEPPVPRPRSGTKRPQHAGSDAAGATHADSTSPGMGEDASTVDTLTRMQTNIDAVFQASRASVASAPTTTTAGHGEVHALDGAAAAESSAVLYRLRSHRRHYVDELQRHSAALEETAMETPATTATPAVDGVPSSDRLSTASNLSMGGQAHRAGLQTAADILGVDVAHLSNLLTNGVVPPPPIASAFATLTYLDISFGRVSSLAALTHFPALDTLVADSNAVTGLADVPTMTSLTTLSLNKNEVGDLAVFLKDARDKLPQLKYLSLLGNPCCPRRTALQGDGRRYKAYAEMVAAFLPALEFLDSHRISSSARDKALENAAVTETLAARFVGSTSAHARSTPTDVRPMRGAERRNSTRRALWAHGSVRPEDEVAQVRQVLSPVELRTADPLLQLAQEKVTTGLLTPNEYLHIAAVHRAVSGLSADGFESEDSLDEDEEVDENREPRAARGSFFGGLLETGLQFLRSTRSSDPIPEEGDEADGATARPPSRGKVAPAVPTSTPVDPDEELAPDVSLLMKSAEQKLRGGVITQTEYDHIVKVHTSAATVESRSSTATETKDPLSPAPQGRCAAVRLSRRQRPQLYSASLSRDESGRVGLAVQRTAEDHIVVALAHPTTHISVGDRILAVNNTVVAPGDIVDVINQGNGPIQLDLLRMSR